MRESSLPTCRYPTWFFSYYLELGFEFTVPDASFERDIGRKALTDPALFACVTLLYGRALQAMVLAAKLVARALTEGNVAFVEDEKGQ